MGFYREIQISNTGAALTDHQVAIRNPLFDETDLRLSLHMNEESGDFARDHSGHMAHLDFRDTSTYEDPVLGWVREFNGSSSAGELNDADSKNIWFSDAITMSAWVYPIARQTISDRDNIVRKRGYITIDPDGYVAVYGYGLSNPGYHLSNTIVPLDEWTHIAWTWSATTSTISIYLNGVLDREITSVTGPLNNEATVLTVGGEITSNNRFFSGRIGLIKIYSRALSLSEIQELYGTNRNYKYDYSDVRILSDPLNPVLELPWWKERDGTWWTKISLPKDGSTSVYFVYGIEDSINPNGDEVFEFFDDFPGTDVDTSKWTEDQISSTTGVFVVENGYLRGQNSNRMLTSLPTFNQPIVMETLVKERTPAINGFMTIGTWTSTTDSLGILTHNGVSYYRSNDSWVQNIINGSQLGAIRDLIASNGSLGRAQRQRLYDGTEWNTDYTITNTINNEPIRLGARYDNSIYSQAYECWWDWIFVYKFTTNEITVSANPEEEQSPISVLGHEFISALIENKVLGNTFSIPIGSSTLGQVLHFPKNSRHDTLGLRTISWKKGDLDGV